VLSLYAARAVAPMLVIAIGNPSRGDDALGPLAAERIEAMNLPDVEVLVDFQLQVEHSLDLAGRRCVLFIDASASLDEPYVLAPVEPRCDASFTSHALAPSAVLFNFQQLIGEPPPAWVLAIRGQSFELGEGLSAPAAQALDAALVEVHAWLARSVAPQASTAPDTQVQVAAAAAVA
jgi:hydrogenase maturation protease